MAGLVAYGSYVPHYRLSRSTIGEAHGDRGAPGERAVAASDEDTTSMGVEAARLAVRALSDEVRPDRLVFATTEPPYLDKTNANVIHAALGLDSSCLAFDAIGSVRSGVGALTMAAESPGSTIVVLSDIRGGLPRGADEREGGDAASAFVFGDGAPAIAELVSSASMTEEFLDRWRLPGEPASRVWEERFGEFAYGPLADAAWSDALKVAGLSPGDIDLLIVAGTHSRAVRAFGGRSGAAQVADDLSTTVGNSGTAHPGLLLADALDRAAPGQTIGVVVLADGATALLFQTTETITQYRPASTLAQQVASGDNTLRYSSYLNWRGHLTTEPPRRPTPTGPSAPPSRRTGSYKFGFVGHRCTECRTLHLPAVRVCINCKAIDHMVSVPMADITGTVATFTIDRLAYSPSPPVIATVIDFDDGGRFSCELTDADPNTVRIGDRVRMTFRKIVTAGGIHNYFWKVRPVDEEEGGRP